MPAKAKEHKHKVPVLKSYTPHVKLLEQSETTSTFRTVGIPFGGPVWLDGKDLHGEFFDRKTNLGKNDKGEVVVNQIFAYYSHALNDAIGKDLIGYAKFYQETDEGQIWDIEVQRAYRYHDMLLSMVQKDLLGASSQPVQTSVDIDWDNGHINQWHPAEISLTPQPANPNALATMKEFNIDLAALIKEAEEADADEPDEEDDTDPAEGEEEGGTPNPDPAAPPPAPVTPPNPDPAAPPAPPPAPVTPPGESLEDEISKMFDQGQPGTPPPTAAIKLNQLVELLVAKMQPMIEQAIVKSLEVEIQKVNVKVEGVGTEVINLKAGVKTFAKSVSENLKMKLVDLELGDQRSDAEREADHIKSGVPNHGPGKQIIKQH